jgi:hypothetical protein
MMGRVRPTRRMARRRGGDGPSGLVIGLAAAVGLTLVALALPGLGPGSGTTTGDLAVATTPVEPTVQATVAPSVPAAMPAVVIPPSSRFGRGLLIADRGNGRLLIVDAGGHLLWAFPGRHSLPAGQSFAADDAFIAPDGRTIVANDEGHQVIDRIDIVSRRVVWQYGHYNRAGSAAGYLHTPDDAYPLANGDVTVADIANCRIIEINPAKRIVRQWGRTGVCRDHAPTSYGAPNGDTPLPDGGLLITEITGSRVVRLTAAGRVVFDIHVPLRYPSDAQLLANGNVLVVDYANPGAIVEVRPNGHVVWRYAPVSGPGRLDHPSLAVLLPDGTIALNDDFRHRVIVVNPRTGRIIWQYGHTDRPSRSVGYLFIPDGIDPIPLGTTL